MEPGTSGMIEATRKTEANSSMEPAPSEVAATITIHPHHQNQNSVSSQTNHCTPNSKYVRDFEALFVPVRREHLRDKARSGSLRQCQFRSLCWRYFLHCLPEQSDQWLEQCIMSRMRYERIKSKYISAKPTVRDGEDQDNDVTQNVQRNERSEAAEMTRLCNMNASQHDSVTPGRIKIDKKEEQLYMEAAKKCDHTNLFRTIERDVVRTFPDMEFFRQIEMQTIMENVLFNYANENPDIAYKQGMHELLATLLYVLHTDAQNCLIYHEGGYSNETISTVLNLKYLEHDVFYLFSALMKSIETWYQNDEILTVAKKNTGSVSDRSKSSSYNMNRNHPNSSSRSNNKTSSNSPRQQVISVLGSKLKMISENIVRLHDRELFNHLEALQIVPQIYGIRWMRLLFGREFEFLDLLTIWDSIICDTMTMSLVDFIFASMLLTIREDLVNGDYTDCLNKLMRHQFKEVQYVIKLALYLRDPKNNRRPRPPSNSSSGLYRKEDKMSYTPQQTDKSQHRQTRSSAQQRARPGLSGSETSLTSKLTLAIIERNESIMRSYRGLMSKVNELKIDHTKSDEATNKTSNSVSLSGNLSDRPSREVEMTTLSVNYPPGQSNNLMSTPKNPEA